MHSAFFPHPVLAWTFYLALIALLVVAAIIDLRKLIIPKWLTLTTLGLGLGVNLIRGAWLGSVGEIGWFTGGNWALGLADGFLYSLAGFALGFAVFFLMWILGVCGGGDVKLFASIGAWVGPGVAVAILAGTIVSVLIVTTFRVAWRLLTGGMMAVRKNASITQQKAVVGKINPKNRLLSYSLPLALSAALVLPWVFRVEMQLASPKPDDDMRAHTHAR